MTPVNQLAAAGSPAQPKIQVKDIKTPKAKAKKPRQFNMSPETRKDMAEAAGVGTRMAFGAGMLAAIMPEGGGGGKSGVAKSIGKKIFSPKSPLRSALAVGTTSAVGSMLGRRVERSMERKLDVPTMPNVTINVQKRKKGGRSRSDYTTPFRQQYTAKLGFNTHNTNKMNNERLLDKLSSSLSKEAKQSAGSKERQDKSETYARRGLAVGVGASVGDTTHRLVKNRKMISEGMAEVGKKAIRSGEMGASQARKGIRSSLRRAVAVQGGKRALIGGALGVGAGTIYGAAKWDAKKKKMNKEASNNENNGKGRLAAKAVGAGLLLGGGIVGGNKVRKAMKASPKAAKAVADVADAGRAVAGAGKRVANNTVGKAKTQASNLASAASAASSKARSAAGGAVAKAKNSVSDFKARARG